MIAIALLLACMPLAAAAAADSGEARERVLEQTNALRKAHELQPLSAQAQLGAAARDFARFMANSGKYGHTADGREPAQRAAAQGYDACIVSENIARLYRSTGYDAASLAREMVDGWRQSPEHRKAMLDPAVTQIGVGIARSDTGRYYGVQLFGRPKRAAIRFSVRNMSGQALSYRAGERRHSLAPRVERTHTLCRQLELRIDLGKQSFAVRPSDGDSYTVVQRGGGLAVDRGARP
jgi:hypothetical protein